MPTIKTKPSGQPLAVGEDAGEKQDRWTPAVGEEVEAGRRQGWRRKYKRGSPAKGRWRTKEAQRTLAINKDDEELGARGTASERNRKREEVTASERRTDGDEVSLKYL